MLLAVFKEQMILPHKLTVEFLHLLAHGDVCSDKLTGLNGLLPLLVCLFGLRSGLNQHRSISLRLRSRDALILSL